MGERIGCRVIDRPTGEMGTVVAASHGRRGWVYKVAWDNPTEYQHEMWIQIPGRWFDWADSEEADDA